MALADILKRIERDAVTEANAMVVAAEAEVEAVRESAVAKGASYKERELARAEREAAEEARTRVATARLNGRDRVLSEKRSLIDRVLTDAVERIVALPDDRYVTLMAAQIADVARGGESVLLGTQDADRLAEKLGDALKAIGSDVTVGATTAELSRGVMLEGKRMRVEISPRALVGSRRTEFEALVMESLFGGDSGN